MIEFDLGDEPEFEDLSFVGTDGYRGDPSTGEDSALDPLKGRVKASPPHGFKITEDRVAGDEGLRRFIQENSDQVDYYFVFMSLSFVAADKPRLESVQLKLTLTTVPDTPAPFVLSIRPDAAGTQMKVERGVTIGPKLSLPVVGDTEIGDVEFKQEYEKTQRFVRALGSFGSTPGWEFTRTAGMRLEGESRLELVVQTGRGAKLSVSGVTTAKATSGSLLWHFRAKLPRPLTFSGDI
jgi:hypothetical protein